MPEDRFLLNLGCGLNAAPGWVNVDKSLGPWIGHHPRIKYVLRRLGVINEQQFQTEWPPGVVRANLARKFPWPDQQADVIYSSHMLEHLSRTDARFFLKECLRVLRSGGLLRLAIPDMELEARRYLARLGNEDAAEEFLQRLHLAYEPRGPLINRLMTRLMHQQHKWMYDFVSLQRLLRSVGYVDITRREFQEGVCPDLDVIEPRPESLFVEARREA